MKIEQIKPATDPAPEIVSIITFDPWPFKSSPVSLSDDVLFVDYDGRIHRSRGYALYRTEDRLAILSDGSTAVLESRYKVGTDLWV